MKTLSITPVSRQVQEQHAQLAARRKKRVENYIHEEVGASILFYFFYVAVGGGFGAAISGAISHSATVSLVTFLVIACTPPVVTILYWIHRIHERIRFGCLERAYQKLHTAGELMDVPDDLLKVWSDRCAAAELDSSEARAQLEQFPDVIVKVVARQVVRNDPQATEEEKCLLDAKIRQIMDEVLVPLATEIHMASQYEAMTKEARLAADRDLLACRIEDLLTNS